MAVKTPSRATISHAQNRIPLSIHSPDTVVEMHVGTLPLPDTAVALTIISDSIGGGFIVALTGAEARWLVARILKQMRGA